MGGGFRGKLGRGEGGEGSPEIKMLWFLFISVRVVMFFFWNGLAMDLEA